MIFAPTSIEGMWCIRVERHFDERGSFGRVFCEDTFAEKGLVSRFLQVSSSRTRLTGTIRGMHLQRPPSTEVKLVQCVRGTIYDVVCDVRPRSLTYLQKVTVELTEGDDTILYIPEGCLHGYQTLSADTDVQYFISARYDPPRAAGIRFDDPLLAIEWPLKPTCISERDLALPNLRPDFLDGP